jgi:gamma-D-glutamyl-L-lysine dipeptidyl-peptidase
MKGACVLPVIPVRSEHSHRSEMVSQLLFGDMYQVIETEGEWLKICCQEDGYHGWIDSNQHYEIKDKEYNRLIKKQRYFTGSLTQRLICYNSHTEILLSVGSTLYGEKEFSIGEYGFKHEGRLYQYDKHEVAGEIVRMAFTCLNIPYLWGGKSVMGYDCSGFVQVIYRMHGISLKRDASQQCLINGRQVPLSASRVADLAFFGEKNRITHVGIILDDNRILHCSGKVRIDLLDETGIFDSELKKHTHRLIQVNTLLV